MIKTLAILLFPLAFAAAQEGAVVRSASGADLQTISCRTGGGCHDVTGHKPPLARLAVRSCISRSLFDTLAVSRGALIPQSLSAGLRAMPVLTGSGSGFRGFASAPRAPAAHPSSTLAA